jgi:hypothetical protein
MEFNLNNLIEATKELKKSARHLKSARSMLKDIVYPQAKFLFLPLFLKTEYPKEQKILAMIRFAS